ncbi:MAG TPA: hypothetical protein VFL04_06090, partial [Rectinemataceae bacterium]|nr:hypothetical protein [Rectinemataceae bacterium]
MADRRRSSGASGGNPGCILWLAAFVVVLLLFVLNWGRIKGTLERTNFNEIVRTQRGLDAGKPEGPAPVAPAPKVQEDPAKKGPPPTAKPAPDTEVPVGPQSPQAPQPKPVDVQGARPSSPQ